MVDPSKKNVQLAGRFIEIANRYTAEGWIEYLLWEVVEGLRDRPFPLLDPLPADELASLQALRDETKIWFYWQQGRWNHVPIAQWKEHASKRTANDVLQELQAR